MAISKDDAAKRVRIRELNDEFRRTLTRGRVLMTSGVNALGATIATEALAKVRQFTAFNADNDPYGQHDFGSFEISPRKFFWKIDYYTLDMQHGSEDPSDPVQTLRVLTLMLAEEY